MTLVFGKSITLRPEMTFTGAAFASVACFAFINIFQASSPCINAY